MRVRGRGKEKERVGGREREGNGLTKRNAQITISEVYVHM